jgi:hypothetical protein
MPRLDTNPPLRLFRLFFLRWLLAAFLVFGTYNPSGTSYYHWVVTGAPQISPAQITVGILIFGLTVAVLRMAFMSTGYIGTAALTLTVLMGLVLGAGLDLFEIEDVTFTTYAIEAVVSIVVGSGLSWAFIQKRLSGERDILRTPP